MENIQPVSFITDHVVCGQRFVFNYSQCYLFFSAVRAESAGANPQSITCVFYHAREEFVVNYGLLVQFKPCGLQ